MKYVFSGNNLKGKERTMQRLLEIIPGAASWFIILGMFCLALKKPMVATVIIIAFYLYWLFRLFYMTIFLILSYFKLTAEKETNWMERANALSGDIPDLKEIYHVVIIPIAKETQDIVEPGILSLSKSTFSTERIVLMLALEERATEEVKSGIQAIKEKYNDNFCDVLIAVHPDGIVGEARAKGANTTYAAKKAKEYFDSKKIPLENVIASCFDSDTVVHKDYCAALAYYFMITPDRTRSSFQPVPVYNNNIWDAPGLTRVLEIGSSFFQLIEATNPEKLVTFSSHSMSFKALVDIDYWPVDMISDDSAIFWKAFIHYDGKYKVTPMYVTVSMDAVVAESWRQTVFNVYKQRRRWAWGVENFPIVMRGFVKDKKIPIFTKLKTGFKLLEGHIAWTTWAFLLTIIGWMPVIFATKNFAHSIFYYSEPRIAGIIFNLASFSLITSIVLSVCLLPKKDKKVSIFKRIGFALQWLLMPLTLIFLSAIPALDAQTRLMLGKYMTFWVTDKKRK